ncbi:MAG TPA: hypothetical protein VH025_09395 [Solirubrobacteraceae bacterium]|jgi:hypothetical protein|nr:hypothetical protein [Solirubrobacteraceae bacterium]
MRRAARGRRTQRRHERRAKRPVLHSRAGTLSGEASGAGAPARGGTEEALEEPEEENAGEASNEPLELTAPDAAQAEEATESDEPDTEPLNATIAAEGSEELPEELTEGQRLDEGLLPEDSGEATIDPSDRRFLTYVPFGTTSFWVQPWRSYMDTWPASRLLNSLGVNFGGGPDAEAIAQLLQDSGFRLARKGISWDALSFLNPATFRNEAKVRSALALLHAHGLRPLIVLDANSQAPTPLRLVKLETLASAATGALTVQLSAASAAKVVPWKTGFNNLTFTGTPDVLITAVDAAGVATLSRPLPQPLPAGVHGGATLRFAPFTTPLRSDGTPNPMFRETMDGWLSYVAAVCRLAGAATGAGGFDLEVWNELTFGSHFLNVEQYEGPVATQEQHLVRKQNNKLIRNAILRETVAFVRNPANGISANVGITDGFTSQSPFASGAHAPLGLTALSKHPYVGAKDYPVEDPHGHVVPIDALGHRDTLRGETAPLYVPHYQSLMPEFTITGNFAEDLLRDVAPFTTYVYGYPHGRFVHPPGGEPPQKWITEFNMGTGRGVPMEADGVTPATSATLSSADKAHFQAKALLRDLIAMVGKGFSRDYFFHASGRGGALNIISPAFVAASEANPGVYPGDELGGETVNGFRSLLSAFQGPGPEGSTRQLQLRSIAQEGDHAQFAGDGTANHPSLYDRDVLGVFPFQSSPTRFEIPYYVMTRDLLTVYRPEAPAGDPRRFDLPDETFRITLGNLPEGATAPSVSATDPLTGASVPARMLQREGSTATFEVAATDYPRVLTVDFAES